FFLHHPPPPRSPLFPYTTLFRSHPAAHRTFQASDGPDAVLFHDHSRREGQAAGKESLLRSNSLGDDPRDRTGEGATTPQPTGLRSEEHTSELQSRGHLVCRLLLE